MLHITDAMIDAAIGPAEVQDALTEAFRSFAAGQGGMQERVRTYGGGVRLSTMGAVLPDQGFAGAKVYTTIDGAFTFGLVLFSTRTGALLASLAARHLARPASATLSVFGVGVQGHAHAEQLAAAFPLRRILLVSQRNDPAVAAEVEARTGVPTRLASADEAIAEADILVTASRAKTPVVAGEAIRPGTFIAAVGSSLPTTRELDDTALSRAALIAVEWRHQSLAEAGDLVLAAPGIVAPEKVVELGELVAGTVPGRRSDDEITLYKSVGVGLEDIAIAGLAYSRISGS
ncbi:MAG: ornithine cyclodeaminase family protein [Rhizobiales bacterium]|nr:ornithine cyclodeaminase family protein [Hyphomicrobiales bacterium]